MKTKQKKEVMTVNAMIVSVDSNTGANKVECFHLDEELQVNPYVVIGHVKERGFIPLNAEETSFFVISDEDGVGNGYLYGFEDKKGRTYRIILEGESFWGEDRSFC